MIGQQRRQVPRMVRMLGPPGIEVAAGIGKAVPLTACSIVDVKGKEPRFRPGKTCHLRFNNHTIFPLEKSHHSAHRWMAAVPANLGDSNGINISLQTITPDSSYAADPSIESIDKNRTKVCARILLAPARELPVQKSLEPGHGSGSISDTPYFRYPETRST